MIAMANRILMVCGGNNLGRECPIRQLTDTRPSLCDLSLNTYIYIVIVYVLMGLMAYLHK